MQLADFRLLSTPLELLASVADILFPPRCYGCLQENTWLCKSCSQKFPIHSLACIICQKPNARGLTCLECRSQTPLHGLISAGSYGSTDLKRAINWLKFKGVRDIAPVLAARVVPYLLSIASLDQLRQEAVLIPVPLHRNRQRQRGFNQSHDVALALSNQTGIPTINALNRHKPTLIQKELPASLRQKNMAQAFSVSESLVPKRRYLIIDDVTTTGATLSAVALHLAKNSEIWGVTVAHG